MLGIEPGSAAYKARALHAAVSLWALKLTGAFYIKKAHGRVYGASLVGPVSNNRRSPVSQVLAMKCRCSSPHLLFAVVAVTQSRTLVHTHAGPGPLLGIAHLGCSLTVAVGAGWDSGPSAELLFH